MVQRERRQENGKLTNAPWQISESDVWRCALVGRLTPRAACRLWLSLHIEYAYRDSGVAINTLVDLIKLAGGSQIYRALNPMCSRASSCCIQSRFNWQTSRSYVERKEDLWLWGFSWDHQQLDRLDMSSPNDSLVSCAAAISIHCIHLLNSVCLASHCLIAVYFGFTIILTPHLTCGLCGATSKRHCLALTHATYLGSHWLPTLT